MELVANGAHNYVVEIAGDHGFDANVTVKSDSPNDFPYTFTKRADGKYVLAFVEGGITGLPRYPTLSARTCPFTSTLTWKRTPG